MTEIQSRCEESQQQNKIGNRYGGVVSVKEYKSVAEVTSWSQSAVSIIIKQVGVCV